MMTAPSVSEVPVAERRRLQARARRLAARAASLASEGRTDEAIVCQNEVTSLRPQDPIAFFRLGLLYREARRTDQAVHALRQAASLSPADRDPREALTETLVEASRFEEAVQEARALIRVAPRSLFARDALSVSYLQMGKLDKALQVTGEMVWLDPLNPGHHFRRGLLFQQQGNVRAAVGEYGRALDMSHPRERDLRRRRRGFGDIGRPADAPDPAAGLRRPRVPPEAAPGFRGSGRGARLFPQ